MIVIYINGEGTAQKVSPSQIYQGSNQTQVTVFAPIPTTSALSIAFRLPDGTRTTYYPMTPIQNSDGLSQYEFTLNSSITQKSGRASIALMAVFSDGRQTSQLIDIEIEPSILPEPPSDIDENAYEIITQYLQQDRSDITALQGQMNDIEETAENAEKAATNAVETANEAKATADGLAASIAQANETANRAETTVNEAVEDIAAYKEKVDKEVEDVTNTANGLAGSIAEANATAECAVDTANGATATAAEAKGIAQEALEQSKVTGTKVNVDGVFAQEVDFNSDPQEQIDNLGATDASLKEQIDNLDRSKVNKAGDSMTGPLINTSGQDVRGYKSVDTSNNLVNEKSGLYENAFEQYSRYLVIGDSGDKFLIGWQYEYPTKIHTKVYNSGNLQVDGIIPYIEPNKLNPSTANGWTMGDWSLKLPSFGLYLMYIDGDMGIFFYTNTYQGSFALQSNDPFKVARYNSSTGWSFSPLTDLSIIVTAATVGYKKLA